MNLFFCPIVWDKCCPFIVKVGVVDKKDRPAGELVDFSCGAIFLWREWDYVMSSLFDEVGLPLFLGLNIALWRLRTSVIDPD